MIRKGYPDRKLLALPISKTANQHSSPEYQGASQRHLHLVESMLLIREPIVVALPKGHKAARKKNVALKDLEGELFMIPSKDLFPSLHQLIATAFVQNHVSLKRYQMVEHFQTAVALIIARAGCAFLPASAKSFVPEGVALRAPSFRIRPLETLALWSNGNVDPLIQRVLSLLKEVRRDLY
jgi:DNA-binding transcriptional LysR family regulator